LVRLAPGFPGPRGHTLVIEVGGDLTRIQTIILKLQNAVNQGLMGRVKRDQGQRLGLDLHLNTKVCRRLGFDPEEGQKEIIPR
jgi:hypothetical protein